MGSRRVTLRIFTLLSILTLLSSCASEAPVVQCTWKLRTLHAGQLQLEGAGQAPLQCADPSVPDMVCMPQGDFQNMMTCGQQ